jgi:hypothetical protein
MAYEAVTDLMSIAQSLGLFNIALSAADVM